MGWRGFWDNIAGIVGGTMLSSISSLQPNDICMTQFAQKGGHWAFVATALAARLQALDLCQPRPSALLLKRRQEINAQGKTAVAIARRIG